MKLNNNDYIDIANQMRDDSGLVNFEKLNEVLEFSYNIERIGYTESTTGAFVTKELILSIEDYDCYNVEEEGESDSDFDESKLYKHLLDVA